MIQGYYEDHLFKRLDYTENISPKENVIRSENEFYWMFLIISEISNKNNASMHGKSKKYLYICAPYHVELK